MPRVHKPDCQCAVCQKIRAKAAKEVVIPPTVLPPTAVAAKAPEVEVQLERLPIGAYFTLNHVRYRVATKEPDCIVCHSLRFFDSGPLPSDKGWTVDKTVSLATFTIVKPEK